MTEAAQHDLQRQRANSDGNSDWPAAGRARDASAGARLLTLPRQLWSYVQDHKFWVLCTVTFALLWTLELFAVQTSTLIPAQEIGPRLAEWGPRIRLMLDLLFASTLVLLLPRVVLAVVSVAAFLIQLGLLTYFAFFQRPISSLTIFNNWWEGLQLSGFATGLFPKQSFIVLVTLLALKLFLLYAARRRPMPWRLRWPLAATFASGYVALSCIAIYLDPLSEVTSTRGVGRLGFTHGYMQVWAAETWYLWGNPEFSKPFRPTDRLTPHEANIPIQDHLVIIQAESLDYNVLGLKVNGKEVTPFLNRLRSQSMFYRIRAVHTQGSADADFVTINGAAGSPHIISYKIPGLRFHSPLPDYLAKFGYETTLFHGNTGRFYNRRMPLERLKFHELLFLEDLTSRYGLKRSEFGVRDSEVLALSAQQLHHQPQNRVCHFVITLTTHSPYQFLRPAEQLIYPHPSSSVERYLNNMHYLDKCLQDYVRSLDAPTTVMLYADHPTEAENTSNIFRPARSNRPSYREYIPVFIFDTSQDLSRLQATRNKPIATDGTLNLVDMTNYFRKQVAHANGSGTTTAHVSAEQKP